VDVITGVIKANITTRIAFQVAAKVDSRTILDAMGADKLLGKGDMLYLPPGSSRTIRAQGVLIVDDEIKRLVDFCGAQGKPQFAVEIVDKLSRDVSADDDEAFEEDEEMIEKSIEVIRQTKRASVSMLQRRLRIGYTRAARIMDVLEERGIVGPGMGSEPREILVDLDAGVPAGAEDEEDG
jgi:S-DNA-T family DNA segregation ATPase FtsK/SpoIIIE